MAAGHDSGFHRIHIQASSDKETAQRHGNNDGAANHDVANGEDRDHALQRHIQHAQADHQRPHQRGGDKLVAAMRPQLHRRRDNVGIFAEDGRQNHQHRPGNMHYLLQQTTDDEKCTNHQQPGAHQLKIGGLGTLMLRKDAIIVMAADQHPIAGERRTTCAHARQKTSAYNGENIPNHRGRRQLGNIDIRCLPENGRISQRQRQDPFADAAADNRHDDKKEGVVNTVAK